MLASLALAPIALAGHGDPGNSNAGNQGGNGNSSAAGSQAGGNANTGGGNGAGHGSGDGNSGASPAATPSPTTPAAATPAAPHNAGKSAAGSQGKAKGKTGSKGAGHTKSSAATPSVSGNTSSNAGSTSSTSSSNNGHHNGNGNGGVGNGNGNGNAKAGTGGATSPAASTAPAATAATPATPTATTKPVRARRSGTGTTSRAGNRSSTTTAAPTPARTTVAAATSATPFASPALLGAPASSRPAGHARTIARTPPPRRGIGSGGASGTGHAPSTLAHDINGIVRVVPVWAWVLLGILAACFFLSATVAAAFARRARYADALVGRIRTAAITDPLTGLHNRRGFADALGVEIARARRFDHPLAVAFLDVRGLKAVNDDFGHQAGDDLLKAVAQLLRRTSREADIVARVGGDEMAVALIEQDRAGAVAFARRIAAEVPHARAELGVLADWDLTVGVAVFPEDGEAGEELLAAADRRLYMRRGIALHTSRR
jgi:diguanylate cyclase (GGDEF)-like protein